MLDVFFVVFGSATFNLLLLRYYHEYVQHTNLPFHCPLINGISCLELCKIGLMWWFGSSSRNPRPEQKSRSGLTI